MTELFAGPSYCPKKILKKKKKKKKKKKRQWSDEYGSLFFFFFSIYFMNSQSNQTISDTVELKWLEPLWDHGNLFEIWVVRATDVRSGSKWR